MLPGLLPEETGETGPWIKLSKGLVDVSIDENRGRVMGPANSGDSSSPRRSDGNKASARGLIWGLLKDVSMSERMISGGSDRPGRVIPLLMLKNELGGKVGELVEGGL